MSKLTDFTGGSGGVTFPISTLLPINSTGDVYTASDETTWLKSGVIETTEGTYPESDYVSQGWSHTGDLSVGNEPLKALAWDGSSFYTMYYSSYWGAFRLKVYSSTGVYEGEYGNLPTGSQDITWNGSHLLVAGGYQVKKYTTTGSYAGIFANIGGQVNNAGGIAWAGTHFWVTCLTNLRVYQYTASGTYTGVSYGLFGYPNHLEWVGTNLWVGDRGSTDRLRELSPSGSYTNKTIYVASNTWGLAWDGTKLWGLDDDANRLRSYQEIFGYGIGAKTDSASNLPIYMRVD